MLQKHDLFAKIYCGTLLSRLHFGRSIHAALGPQVMQDETFAGSFDTLREYADALSRQMDRMGMGKICSACSAQNRGGCCSRAIAEETDAIQMLMNMLAGVDVGIVCDKGGECCFLGEKGCSFMFKPMFCLNYNCHKIIADTTPAERSVLEYLTGRLLGKQYEIETLLLATIDRSMKTP